jgi:5-(carboxyamino)imidazole ribonucleotide mutase
MGSDSDLPVMQAAADMLDELAVPYEMTIVSAHRTPKRLYDYAGSALDRGLKVIIAGAGGAAHLPGMAAAITPLPVIGVPVKTSTLGGEDSLLSIVQMPGGVPVATVAINGAKNAGILAAQMLAIGDHALLERIRAYKESLEQMVLDKVAAWEKSDT